MHRLGVGHAWHVIQVARSGIVIDPDDVHGDAAIGCAESAVAMPLDFLPVMTAPIRGPKVPDLN